MSKNYLSKSLITNAVPYEKGILGIANVSSEYGYNVVKEINIAFYIKNKTIHMDLEKPFFYGTGTKLRENYGNGVIPKHILNKYPELLLNHGKEKKVIPVSELELATGTRNLLEKQIEHIEENYQEIFSKLKVINFRIKNDLEKLSMIKHLSNIPSEFRQIAEKEKKYYIGSTNISDRKIIYSKEIKIEKFDSNITMFPDWLLDYIIPQKIVSKKESSQENNFPGSGKHKSSYSPIENGMD